MKTLEERFFAKTRRAASGCLLWTAATLKGGYGVIGVGPHKIDLAHRVAWRLANGDLPEGAYVLHRCDVRSCVEPAHLFLGTHTENMADMTAKKRQARGRTAGNSRLTDEQVMEIRRAASTRLHSQADLAAMYNISQQQVSRLLLGLAWAHLPLVPVAPRLRRERALLHRPLGPQDGQTAGEANGNGKLTDAIVRDVRARAAAGESQRSIAKRYGVTKPCIGNIIRRDTWRHVS